jgi:hypothetical protein
MGQIDVSELINDPDFVQPLTLIRRKAPPDSFGETQIQEIGSPTHGSVQPAGGKVIARLPDALRIANVQSFWIREKFVTDSQNSKYPDIIVKNGIRFVVQLVFDWSDWGAGWSEGVCVAERPTG